MRKKIHSWDLGINLKSGKAGEVFKWFLACLLFGKPIRQEVARRTYFEFRKAGITTQQKILDAGWDELVDILDRGGYVRYDLRALTNPHSMAIKALKKARIKSCIMGFRQLVIQTFTGVAKRVLDRIELRKARCP